MSETNRRVAAKKVLEAAKKYAGKDVIVVAQDRAGEFYLATSMPTTTPEDFDRQIAFVQEGLKRLRKYRANMERALRG